MKRTLFAVLIAVGLLLPVYSQQRTDSPACQTCLREADDASYQAYNDEYVRCTAGGRSPGVCANQAQEAGYTAYDDYVVANCLNPCIGE